MVLDGVEVESKIKKGPELETPGLGKEKVFEQPNQSFLGRKVRSRP